MKSKLKFFVLAVIGAVCAADLRVVTMMMTMGAILLSPEKLSI